MELNDFTKRVRNGELTVEELISALSAFSSIISTPQKLSPAFGGLLALLFAQLEFSWSGEIFGADIRSVQLVLLKRIFVDDGEVDADNLVVWAGALKEMKLLSNSGKDWILEWILKRCEKSNPLDWPILFHNLLCTVDRRIFWGLVNCLKDSDNDRISHKNRNGRALMDHFIFLAGQNGKLGKAWIRWVIGSRGPFGTTPFMFSGLLILGQDMEY